MAAAATATATATARRATSFVLAVALALFSCGGGALGFVLPSAASSAAAAPAMGVQSHSTALATSATTATARPRAPFRLFSSKGPPPSPKGADIMDNIAGLGRELSTEEKIAALQKEVQAQAALVAETDEKEEKERGLDGDMAIPGEAEEEEEKEESFSPTDFFSKKEKFETEPGFVDEGKNIKWPNARRAAQLTVLAVVAQIAFIVYIISLNSFMNAFPDYFQQFVDLIKSGDIAKQVRLPDL